MGRQSMDSPLMNGQHSFSEGFNDAWAGRDASFLASADYMRGWHKGHSALLQSQVREQQILLASASTHRT
jgi:hypothetical protein